MRLGTPRSEQGQTVEYAYGWHDGDYYMRTTDRTDGSVEWHRADAGSRDRLAESSYDAGGENDPPDVAEWVTCEDPSPD